MAVEYVIKLEIQGVAMTNKGMGFVIDGIPVDLSVMYSDVTSTSNIYYDNFIKSFGISPR